MTHDVDPGAKVVLSRENADHQKNERKWMAIFGPGASRGMENTDMGLHFRTFRKGKRAKFLRLVMRGIPESCRARAWSLFLDPKCEGGKAEFPFASASRRLVPRGDNTIRTDVARIVGHAHLFTTRDIRESLYQVIRAYITGDHDIDYWPGMGYPAALLVAYMNDESAYWSFCHFMKGPKRHHRELYTDQFANLNNLNLVWDGILRSKFPKVAANLKKLGIESKDYTNGWFLAAFQGIPFPAEFRLRIFDRLCAFGTRTLLSFAITIVSAAQKDLETGRFDGVTTMLKDPARVPLLQDPKKAISKWDGLFLTKKEYVKCFTKAGVPLFK